MEYFGFVRIGFSQWILFALCCRWHCLHRRFAKQRRWCVFVYGDTVNWTNIGNLYRAGDFGSKRAADWGRQPSFILGLHSDFCCFKRGCSKLHAVTDGEQSGWHIWVDLCFWCRPLDGPCTK